MTTAAAAEVVPQSPADRLLRIVTENLVELEASDASKRRMALEVEAFLDALGSAGADALPALTGSVAERLLLVDAARAELAVAVAPTAGLRLLGVLVEAAGGGHAASPVLREVERLLNPDPRGGSAWERLLRSTGPQSRGPAETTSIPTELGIDPAVLAHLGATATEGGAEPSDPLVESRAFALPAVRPGWHLDGRSQALLGPAGARIGDRFVLRLDGAPDLATLHPLELRRQLAKTHAATDDRFDSSRREMPLESRLEFECTIAGNEIDPGSLE